MNTGSRLVLPLVVFAETNFHSHVKVMESSTGLNKRPETEKTNKFNTFIKHYMLHCNLQAEYIRFWEMTFIKLHVLMKSGGFAYFFHVCFAHKLQNSLFKTFFLTVITENPHLSYYGPKKIF